MSVARKILIIGGVAGGASAAARMRRLSEKDVIILFERGEFISFANCGLPYHISGIIPERDELLLQSPQGFKKRFNVEVRIHSEITFIHRDLKEVTVYNHKDNQEYNEKYDQLILSPGAEPFLPDIPGIHSERVFTLRNMKDMDVIKSALSQKSTKHVAVIGGGYIGLEMVEALHHLNLSVSCIEQAPQVMTTLDPEMAYLLQQHLEANKISLYLKQGLHSITEQEQGLLLKLTSGTSISCDCAIIAIGVRPETELAKSAHLELGLRGGIKVNKKMQTNDPNIFAVGDAIECEHYITNQSSLIPLAGPANRQARIAANNIAGYSDKYDKTQGTAICKVLKLTAACTGANEKLLKSLDLKYEKIYVHPLDHSGYYPDAKIFSMKVIYDKDSGKILGAQAVGHTNVDKRIDVIAVAIRSGLSIYSLAELELCYAPPFGSAKDPVNYVGFIARNIRENMYYQCHYEDFINSSEQQILLDVRTKSEYNAGTIKDAINIPVDDLRDRIAELPKNKEILVFCRVGIRGYIATRILLQLGFQCKNLSGGILTYQANAFYELNPT